MSDITRTFAESFISVKVFDDELDNTRIIPDIHMDGKYSLELGKSTLFSDIKKLFKNSPDYAGLTPLKITNIKVDEWLYSMTESEFMRYGKQVPERSKETRDSVTKEVISKVAVCKVWDMSLETTIEEEFSLPRPMTKDEAKRHLNKRLDDAGLTVVKVLEIKDINALYHMPIDMFKTLATKLPPREKLEQSAK